MDLIDRTPRQTPTWTPSNENFLFNSCRDIELKLQHSWNGKQAQGHEISLQTEQHHTFKNSQFYRPDLQWFSGFWPENGKIRAYGAWQLRAVRHLQYYNKTCLFYGLVLFRSCSNRGYTLNIETLKRQKRLFRSIRMYSSIENLIELRKALRLGDSNDKMKDGCYLKPVRCLEGFE